MKSGLRAAIVVVAICAWFAISNHCAFAALATNSTPSRECPFHSKPKEKPSTGAQCCKILRALASVPAKSWSRDDTKLSNADASREECAPTGAYSHPTLVPLSLDTGPPPRVRSFAELILQRSLLAHAPPPPA
jgi:hypothetical protein